MPRLTVAVAPRYRVVGFVDQGGMGCVFEGEDTHLGKRVAFKVLPTELASATDIERFHREKAIQARLSHPHIVSLVNFIEAPDLLVHVMDFMEGETLQKAIARGPLPRAQVQGIGSQLLSALAYIHQQGIVHRDIKPANIFLRGDHAMLGDFGIAVGRAHDDEPLTEPRGLLGSIGYMPPEQLKGLSVDARTDLSALGIVLRESLTGERPATDAGAVVPWRGVPPAVRPVLERAVKEDPAERWPDAATFQKAWESSFGEQRPAPVSRRARIIAMTVAAVVILLAASWPPCRFAPWLASCRVAPTADLAIMPFNGDDADPRAGPPFSRLLEGIGWFTPISVEPMSRTEAWWTALPASARNQPPPFGRMYTEGWLTTANGRLTAQVTVRDQREQPVATVQLTADTGHRQELARALSVAIVCKAFSEHCATIQSTFYRLTDPATLDAFFAGKDSIALGRWDAGERHFREALRRDRFFMPAAWELMMALRFQRKDHQQLLTFINTWPDSLPELYRRLTAAAATADVRARLNLMQGVVEDFPRSGTALLLYGNELFHRGALAGRSLRGTVDSLRGWAKREPAMNQASTWDLTWWGDLRLGEEAAAVRDLEARKALDLPASDTYDQFQWIGIYARFRPLRADVQNWLLRQAATPALRAQVQQYMRLSSLMDVPSEQMALGTLLRREGTPAQALTGAIGMAVAHAMLGRPSAAIALLDSLAAQAPELGLASHEWAVHLGALGLYSDTARINAAVAWFDSASLSGHDAVRARYALARHALTRGDTARGSVIAASLKAMAPDLPAADRHAALIEAELQGLRGSPEQALRSSDVIYLRDTSQVRLAPFARATTYLKRAEWQLAMGDRAAADRELMWYENADFEGWLTGAPQEGEVDAVLSVYARILRGELGGEQGCRHLGRVLQLWRTSDIDPSTRPLRARAAQAREALKC